MEYLNLKILHIFLISLQIVVCLKYYQESELKRWLIALFFLGALHMVSGIYLSQAIKIVGLSSVPLWFKLKLMGAALSYWVLPVAYKLLKRFSTAFIYLTITIQLFLIITSYLRPY